MTILISLLVPKSIVIAPKPQIQEKPVVAQEETKKAIEEKPILKPIEKPKQKTISLKYPDGICVEVMKGYFPESDWQIAYAVMMAESGASPDAVGGPNGNGTYDYGCFQINNEPSALDPYINARRAFEKRSSSLGWRHWTTYKNGKYLKYL